MRFSLSAILGIILLLPLAAMAGEEDDEGMWLPLYIKQFNEKTMQSEGLKLGAEDIYNINKSSIKDAIVSLGGGTCTGEIISREGLVLTNHHCGFDAIADHSTSENDYLHNGFWARKRMDELPNPGLTASILVYMEDVTQLIMSQVADVKNEEIRQNRIEIITDSIVRATTAGTEYSAQVKSFFKTNEYYLLVSQVFRDVRLVGGPPSGIGKFGGETDNWMWPRHTGDFSMFRIYTSPDGKPADYSPNNIPYKPKYFLPISLKGVKKNDFTMILGYPGSTNRYLASYDLELMADYINPAFIESLQIELDVLKRDMETDRELALRLSPNFASSSNNYKYLVGQERQLRMSNLINVQKEKEKKFNSWVAADPIRQKKYGKVLENIRLNNERMKEVEPILSYLNSILGSPPIEYGTLFAPFYEISKEERKARKAMFDSLKADIRPKVDKYFDAEIYLTDKKIFEMQLVLLYKHMPQELRQRFFDGRFNRKLLTTNPEAAVKEYVDKVYETSVLLDKKKANAFLDNPKPGLLKKDPFFSIITELVIKYVNSMENTRKIATDSLWKNHKVYQQGLREWQGDKNFYPDANSTLRLTYGTVLPYFPRDAVYYKYYSTYTGILEKNDPKDIDFQAPKEEIELLKNKKFGRYGENDTLRVCFLTNTDITGGNSGSPVLNAEGKLIGVAFDGTWESMTSDLYVDPSLNRTIAVDIRYVLWVIDVFAGADFLIKEMSVEE